VRTYGRIYGGIWNSPHGIVIRNASGGALLPWGAPPGGQFPAGAPRTLWVEVSTDANGNNDLVWLVTLCQVLQGSPGESPFYAGYGIPAYQSVLQRVYPDYYVALTQQQFSQYFASLVIARPTTKPPANPVYEVNVTTHQGVKLQANVPIPT
jgi:hypothetical protein